MNVNYLVAIAMDHIVVEDNCLMILCKCGNEPNFPFFLGAIDNKITMLF
jgi:CDGSH-type Zn-finger protein